jgi:hypothetical protein
MHRNHNASTCWLMPLLEMQAKGISLLAKEISLQGKGISLQVKGILQQVKGISLQVKGISVFVLVAYVAKVRSVLLLMMGQE